MTPNMLLVWLLAAMLVWASPTAGAEGKVMYVCTQEDPLNVREWASTRAPWVYRLDQGEAVTVLEVRDGWAYVERCGDYGWAWAEYLTDTPPVDEMPDGWLAVEDDL